MNIFSTIYLPSGARILITVPWVHKKSRTGNIHYYTGQGELIGTITAAGVAHFSSDYHIALQPGQVAPPAARSASVKQIKKVNPKKPTPKKKAA